MSLYQLLNLSYPLLISLSTTIYKQTYGTPMGSPLSPVIADVVMQDLETACLNRINCQLTFYFRYVDYDGYSF